jgi:hypothetical protein
MAKKRSVVVGRDKLQVIRCASPSPLSRGDGEAHLSAVIPGHVNLDLLSSSI